MAGVLVIVLAVTVAYFGHPLVERYLFGERHALWALISFFLLLFGVLITGNFVIQRSSSGSSGDTRTWVMWTHGVPPRLTVTMLQVALFILAFLVTAGIAEFLMRSLVDTRSLLRQGGWTFWAVRAAEVVPAVIVTVFVTYWIDSTVWKR